MPFESLADIGKCHNDSRHRSLSCSSNNSLPFHELSKRRFFPVSYCSWLTLLDMQTIRGKKETNYHSYNCFTLFCSSMACVIAFREKNIIRKRSPILIVERFFYIAAFSLSLCFSSQKASYATAIRQSFLCVKTSRQDQKRSFVLSLANNIALTFPLSVLNAETRFLSSAHSIALLRSTNPEIR